jgi:hypothetical protein
MWETTDNYRGQTEVFNCDSGPRLGPENVILLNVLSYFLTKKSHIIVREINRYEEEYNNVRGNFSHFVHL